MHISFSLQSTFCSSTCTWMKRFVHLQWYTFLWMDEQCSFLPFVTEVNDKVVEHFCNFREKLQKLHQQDGIGNGKFICKRSASFREEPSSQSLGFWVCQASCVSEQVIQNLLPCFATILRQKQDSGETHNPPLTLTILWPLREKGHRHTHAHTHMHWLNPAFPSAQNEAAANVLKQTNAWSLCLKSKKLSGLPLDEVMSVPVYLIPLLQKLSPSKLMVLFRE